MATNSGSAQSAPPERTLTPIAEQNRCQHCGGELPGNWPSPTHHDLTVCITALQADVQRLEEIITQAKQLLTIETNKAIVDPRWPVGARVVTTRMVWYQVIPGTKGTIPIGTWGQVACHLEDGRIGVQFDKGYPGTHTFADPHAYMTRIID